VVVAPRRYWQPGAAIMAGTTTTAGQDIIFAPSLPTDAAAIQMSSAPAEKPRDEFAAPIDPDKLAVFPLTIPYLLNPVGGSLSQTGG
jgi:multiple antibiotic resistance protein